MQIAGSHQVIIRLRAQACLSHVSGGQVLVYL